MCFSPHLGVRLVLGGEGGVGRMFHKLCAQFSTLYSTKWKVAKPIF